MVYDNRESLIENGIKMKTSAIISESSSSVVKYLQENFFFSSTALNKMCRKAIEHKMSSSSESRTNISPARNPFRAYTPRQKSEAEKISFLIDQGFTPDEIVEVAAFTH